MRLSFLKEWYLLLALFLVLGGCLGAGPIWGEPIRGEGNLSVMLQPLPDSELAAIAGKNAWVPLPELTRRLPPFQTVVVRGWDRISKQASVLRQQGRVILDSVSDTLGRVKVRFPAP